MRAVIQRVSQASVTVNGESIATIARGFLVLIGVRTDDSTDDAAYIADKIINLRIFEDDAGKMNLSVTDIGGAALIVSQFTLYGDVRKGRRPSFTESASGESAESLYMEVVRKVAESGIPTHIGRFGAMMQITLTNHGPVTILVDSRKVF